MKVRTDLILIVVAVLLASIFPVDLVPSALHDLRGTDGQLSGKQGELLLVRLPVTDQATVVGRFFNRRIPFFPDGDVSNRRGYLGLVGIDLQDPPGNHELSIDVLAPEGTRRLSYNVLVMKSNYPVQRLTLPREQVDLDEATLLRVKGEQEQVRKALERMTEERYWSGPFVQPVAGPVSGAFGRVRIINGQPRNPHYGEDIAAPLGTDVVAMNDGVVRLMVDHFFAGKGLFLDHGLGLYSMYFHLSEVAVQVGQAVKRGQIIGKVGASGRASGPHLHWGVWVNGARVDPASLLRLSFDPSIPASR